MTVRVPFLSAARRSERQTHPYTRPGRYLNIDACSGLISGKPHRVPDGSLDSRSDYPAGNDAEQAANDESRGGYESATWLQAEGKGIAGVLVRGIAAYCSCRSQREKSDDAATPSICSTDDTPSDLQDISDVVLIQYILMTTLYDYESV